MQITGTITTVFDEQQGVSRAGNAWRKQEYNLLTADKYPKTVHFSAMNSNIDTLALRPGELVTLEIDIESREFNGRWYTDVTAWKRVPQQLVPAPAPGGYKEETEPPF